jgi:hypothetical protein
LTDHQGWKWVHVFISDLLNPPRLERQDDKVGRNILRGTVPPPFQRISKTVNKTGNHSATETVLIDYQGDGGFAKTFVQAERNADR